MAFPNYDAFEFAKTDQSKGTTGVVVWPIYTVGGAHAAPIPGTSYNETKYLNSGTQLVDNVPNAFQMNGSPSGLVDCEGLVPIIASMMGLPTTTGTSPYTHTFNTIGTALPIIYHSNYSSAANSTAQHSRAMVTSLVLSGQHGNATEGKMTTQFNYISGKPEIGKANPSLSTIDKQDCLALGSVASRATVIQFTTSGSVDINYEDYTDAVDSLTISRNATNAAAYLSGNIEMGLAYPDAVMDFMIDFTYNAMSGGGAGTAAEPDWSGIGAAYGSTTKALPSTLGFSDTGTGTVEIYGGLIAGSDYFKLSMTGTAMLVVNEPDVNAMTAGVTMKFIGVPTIAVINTTASYTLPT